MYRILFVATCVSVLGCGGGGDVDPDATLGDPDAAVDPDAEPPATACTGAFGAALPVPGLSSVASSEFAARFSPDELTVYFSFGPVGDIVTVAVATRASLDDSFGAPQAIAAVATDDPELTPTVTADELTLVYTRWTEPAALWMSTRTTTDDDFGAPVHLAALDGHGYARHAFLTPDGGELWFATLDGVFVAPRVGDTYQDPVVAIAGFGELVYPTLSPDGLTLYVGETPQLAVQRAERESVAEPFGARQDVIVPATADVIPTWVSADGCRLYLYTTGVQNNDVLMATRAPQIALRA